MTTDGLIIMVMLTVFYGFGCILILDDIRRSRAEKKKAEKEKAE